MVGLLGAILCGPELARTAEQSPRCKLTQPAQQLTDRQTDGRAGGQTSRRADGDESGRTSPALLLHTGDGVVVGLLPDQLALEQLRITGAPGTVRAVTRVRSEGRGVGRSARERSPTDMEWGGWGHGWLGQGKERRTAARHERLKWQQIPCKGAQYKPREQFGHEKYEMSFRPFVSEE